ncbi:hypothetical protein [Moheibacter sediminis]|uniref:YARHG domain-containing protein n=1 Tax=Moheibacter sediminis TaxID=1434700 RepID=A0A1W1ZAH1_9FLAO|nr:hypothetical protein [Moheibacter sediminis]SMC45211.1 hypothetical protein SAMN06296427_102294 [Moheibacter sediminis]
MKNKLFLGLIFFGINLFAQEMHTFKYRLDYKLEGVESDEASYFNGKHFLPEKFTDKSKTSLVIFPYFSLSSSADFSLIHGNKVIGVTNQDLDNTYKISNTNYYNYGESVRVLYDYAILKKIEREPLKILDRSCNHYQVFAAMDGAPETNVDLIFCIDETSEIDNVSFLIQQKENPVKGLLLAIAPTDADKNERIALQKITNINSTIKIDVEKELAAYQIKKDSLDKVYNSYDYPVDTAYATTDVAAYDYYSEYMNQPEFCNYTGFYDLVFEGDNSFSVASTYMSNLCSNTYYLKKGDEEKFKNFALKEIKNIKKNYVKSGLMPKKDAAIFYEFLKKDLEKLEKSKPKTDAELAIEAAAAEADAAAYAVAVDSAYYEDGYSYDVYVSDYESNYKTVTPDNSNFAIESLMQDTNSSYWKGMPTYCKKMDSVIPDFKDADLKKHAKNYAGQICDMYMGEFDGTGVWYKGTLDAIRAEQLYFNNNKDKFSKKDKELLDEFLNSLD